MADKWWQKPTADRPSGTYIYSTLNIALSTPVPGATIYYTTDGSVPTNANFEYSEEITLLSGETIITARTYKDGKYSAPSSYIYNLVGLADAEEHVEISVSAEGTLTNVDYHDTRADEHIEFAVSATGKITYGLSSQPVSTENIADENGDYGKIITLTLDYPVTGTDGNAAAFAITDDGALSLAGQTISASADGLTLTIGFVDFNNASGDITLTYTPGTIQSPATAMEAWTITFTPTGLVPTAANVPMVTEVINI